MPYGILLFESPEPRKRPASPVSDTGRKKFSPPAPSTKSPSRDLEDLRQASLKGTKSSHSPTIATVIHKGNEAVRSASRPKSILECFPLPATVTKKGNKTVRSSSRPKSVSSCFQLPNDSGRASDSEEEDESTPYDTQAASGRHVQQVNTRDALQGEDNEDSDVIDETNDDNDSDYEQDESDEDTESDDSDSEHDEDSDSEAEALLKQESCIDFIYNLLCLKNICCGKEKHQSYLSKHLEKFDGEGCHDLSHTYDQFQPFVRAASSSCGAVGLGKLSFPKAENHNRTRFIEAKALRDQFSGSSTSDVPARRICLHQEWRPDTTATIEYDVDSMIAVMDSLASIKSNVRITFNQVRRYKIKGNLHFKHRAAFVDKDDAIRFRRVRLEKMPHIYIGTIPESYHSQIFCVFPLMASADKSTHLSQLDFKRFQDHVLLPAVQELFSSGKAQYIPPNSQTVNDKARAPRREQFNSTGRNSTVYNDYHVPGEDMRQLSDIIKRLVDQPNEMVKGFQHALILVNNKNTKVEFKSKSLLQTLKRYRKRIDTMFVYEGLTLLSDVAVEICPPKATGAHDTESATVYLWRRCCQQRILSKMKKKMFNNKKGKVKEYNNGMLRDATSITVTPPARSPAAKAGFHYLQAYNSVKVIEDANKVRPFRRSDLANLAIAKKLYDMAKFKVKRANLESAYCASKSRISKTYKSYLQTSSASRLEVRSTDQILKDIETRAKRDSETAQSDTVARDPLESVWVISQRNWSEFMVGNYEKITSAIDIAVLSSPVNGVSLRTSRLLYALFEYLRSFSNCDPREKSLLWREPKEEEGGMMYGLGMETTLGESGFGWWKQIVDWERFCFEDYVDDRLFGIGEVLAKCYTDGSAISHIYHAETQVEVCHEALRFMEPQSIGEKFVLDALAHFVIRQYRRDVLEILNWKKGGELRESYNSLEARDDIAFCWEGLKQALIQEPYIVAVKGRTKGLISHPRDLFDWLMTSNPRYRRDRFDKADGVRKPYRVMLREIDEAVHRVPGRWETWMTCLEKAFREQLWVLPYPDSAGSLTSTVHGGGKQTARGVRRFYSAIIEENGHWASRGTERREGCPPTVSTLAMEPERLREYFQHRGAPSKVLTKSKIQVGVLRGRNWGRPP